MALGTLSSSAESRPPDPNPVPPPPDNPQKLRIDELRRKLSAITGPGHGEECAAIIAEIMALHAPRPVREPRDLEKDVKQFLKRPGLPSEKSRN